MSDTDFFYFFSQTENRGVMICNDNTAVQKNYNDTALVFIGYYYRLFVGRRTQITNIHTTLSS